MPTTTEPSVASEPIAVPETMRAAAVDTFGPASVLTIHTLPIPELDRGEILIAVDTAGVGVWDAGMRAGAFTVGTPRFPMVLGSDGSGRVADVGPGVRRFKVGDPVYAYAFANPKGGFYAEYVAVAEESAASIPRRLTMLEAGAIGTTGLTALQGVDDVLQVKPGEHVLIHGGSGGVGVLAVQFAKRRGARVFATASGGDGVALVQRLGADAVVEARHGDLPAAVRRFAPEGVDAVLGLAGGDTLERCIDQLKPGGRVAYPNGVEPPPAKRPEIHNVAYDALAGPRQFTALDEAIEAAKLQIPIAGVHPLRDAPKAHERIEAGHVLGKIVLRIDRSGR